MTLFHLPPTQYLKLATYQLLSQVAVDELEHEATLTLEQVVHVSLLTMEQVEQVPPLTLEQVVLTLERKTVH